MNVIGGAANQDGMTPFAANNPTEVLPHPLAEVWSQGRPAVFGAEHEVVVELGLPGVSPLATGKRRSAAWADLGSPSGVRRGVAAGVWFRKSFRTSTKQVAFTGRSTRPK